MDGQVGVMEDQVWALEDKVVDLMLNHLCDSLHICAFCNHLHMYRECKSFS